jgi:hypothetical protein
MRSHDPATLDVYLERTRGDARPILPQAVCRAHEYAKNIGRLYVEEFAGELLSLAFKVYKERRSGG